MSTDIDFSQPSTLRQFELIVEKKSVFVNSHYLAELSPYFELLCFGNFREASEGRAELEDELYDEFVEFLQFVCPDSQFMLSKKVTDSNFALLVHFSHLMQFPLLRQRLESFIETEFSSETYRVKEENLVDMIIEAKDAGFPASLVEAIYSRLGQVGLERVKELTKHLPEPYAEMILHEVQRFIKIYPTSLGYSSAYHYGDFDRRVFF